MADALASGASDGNIVWVQVPSPAFKAKGSQRELWSFLFALDAGDGTCRRMRSIRHLVPCSASVGAKPTSPGRRAPHLLQFALDAGERTCRRMRSIRHLVPRSASVGAKKGPQHKL